MRHCRILMVDDDPTNLRLLEGFLTHLGFTTVRTLTDSTCFLDSYEEFGPDLVITDLEMPEVDGVEIVQRVRERLSATSHLPILVLTGTTDTKAKQRALAAGATDLLGKPFDPSELQMRVRNLLQTRIQHLVIERQNKQLEETVAARTAELKQALVELRQSQRQVIQQERFRAFGEMAGGVVHDFNNALMSIVGYSDVLLCDDTLMDDQELRRHYLTMMNTAGRDAAQVVARLRDFYRPREDGDVFAVVEVNELLEQVVPLTKPKWHDHALATGRIIKVELELMKVPPILGNAAELREVLTNLIFNAVDAMPDGGSITMRSFARDEAVVIEVEDSGTGMSEEVRQSCLEPFYSTKGDRGTGLGLSVAFGIIRRHEGALGIDSAPGQGTTFRLELPAHCDAAEASQQKMPAPQRSLHVLIVDDEPGTREVLTQYLEADGHRVLAAKSGSEAMKHVITERIDLVITDHGMPGMNGLELANAIGRISEGTPVVLLSGFNLDASEVAGLVKCFLRKPLIREELRRVVHGMLASDGALVSLA